MYRKNMRNILKMRGYKITGEEDDEIYFKNNKKKGKVVFLSKPKANVDDLGRIFGELVKNPIHVIVVYKVMTNPAIKSFNDDIKHYFKDSELIQQDKLIRNPIKHRLTPTAYKKLTKQEKKEVLKNYGNISPEKFPTMLETDVMSILYGFKDGDVIEITSHYNFTEKRVDMEMPPQITYCYVQN